MKIPLGRCLVCEQRKQMWRCVDITGGGTFHGVCFECRDKYAQQSMHLTALRRWLAGSFFIIIALLAVVAFIIGGR